MRRLLPFPALLRSVATIGFFLSLVPIAQAQISVRLEPLQRTFVAHSPVYMKVAVTNRSGRPVTLSGPTAAASWLDFRVTDGKQNLVTPRPHAPLAAPLAVANAKTVPLKVNLNQVYPVDRFGNYQVTANIYDPVRKQYVSSPPVMITIDEAKPIWSEVVGVGGGKRSEFSLLSYRGFDNTTLYYRLKDATNGYIRKTYKLGELIQYQSPQAAVDRQQKMHVLYQAAPRQYVHDIVDKNGKFLKRKVYEEAKGKKPQLIQSTNGSVSVAGGMDPEVKKRQEREKLKDLTRIRRSSDRPLGY